MPSNWLYVDSQFPNFNGDETTEEKLAQLQNYLYLLVEQMRYTTQNLDTTNVNQNALTQWENALTRPIYAQIEGEGERITQLSVTANGLKAMVQGQQESIQQLEDSAQGQIQVIQEVQQALGEQGGMITDIQGTVTSQKQQLSQLELTAQGLTASVKEQETKLTEFEGTLTTQGEDIGTLEGTIQAQTKKLADLALTADGLTATVSEQTQTITQITGTVTGQGERLEQLTENLAGFTDTVTGSLEGLQAQIDGQIQTWFYDYIPTADNAPASTWVTQEDKINHLGDIFYIVENDTIGGQAYRWANVSGTYQWVLIEDVEVAKALADAAKAQDTADGKRRVFVSQPTPPYDVGDLWAQGSSGDLMRCNTARASGAYVASDWGKASDYTNDDALHEFVDGTFTQTRKEITQKLSELDVKADSISATVEQHTTQITEVNQKVDGIEVGGRNLLLESECPILRPYNGAVVSVLDSSVAVEEWGGITGIRYLISGGESRIKAVCGNDKVSVKGQQYTFSAFIKNNSEEPVTIATNGVGGNMVLDPGFSKRVIIVGIGNGSSYLQFVLSTGAEDIDIVCSRFKIELGNTPTDWTPAPEDTQSDINDLQDTTANQGQIITSQESRIADLEVNTNTISATVQRVQTETKTTLDGVEQSMSELTQRVNLSLTPEQVDIAIEQKLADGVETVKTATGFTFDEEGLTVSKTGSEMTTQITEDGMTVRRNNDQVLVADSQGVQATNLHANTYLIIGGKTRLEAYGTNRVTCFWIGG